MARTGRKWSTDKCGRCDKPHQWYSGKTDAAGIEYVVCGSTNKRMNVSGQGLEGYSVFYSTEWYPARGPHPLTGSTNRSKPNV